MLVAKLLMVFGGLEPESADLALLLFQIHVFSLCMLGACISGDSIEEVNEQHLEEARKDGRGFSWANTWDSQYPSCHPGFNIVWRALIDQPNTQRRKELTSERISKQCAVAEAYEFK